jgi:cytochrome c biogenesis protein CcdA
VTRSRKFCGSACRPKSKVNGASGGRRCGFGAIFAVGAWPCSGAILVLVFGVGLLLGYIAAERVTCF